MRPSFPALALVLATTLSSNAQQVSPERADNSWKKLATVKSGQSIDVKLAREHWTCKLDTLEQDRLTCDSPSGELVFYRSEVASIKVNHRTWPWLTSPWFVVPVFSGGVGAVAA